MGLRRSDNFVIKYDMSTMVIEVIKKVHNILQEKNLTVSVAESCTGGLLSHYLTTLPGSSSFFEAGVVSYSVGAKKSILGISSETISNYGVISDETAREMAEKIRLISGADYSISTTGNLGPGAMEGKDSGLIYIAVSSRKQTFSREIRLSGDREKNKEDAAILALEFFIDIIMERHGREDT
ncbi:MAG: CinA family protein [Thermodesulfovibrionales bacterium]|nr:CinA family protein [Thermodesulfovibrionales bacterium]